MTAQHPTTRPGYLRALMWRLRAAWAVMSALADWESRATLLRSRFANRDKAANLDPIRLRIKALDGGELFVRPRSTDISSIATNYVEGLHLPPQPLRDQDLLRICELGSAIGTGLAGLAVRYPHAEILGVEPDPANARLARRNIAVFAERCRLVEAAIWDEEAVLTIGGDTPSSRVVGRSSHAGAPTEIHVRARTIDDLLADEMPDGSIDYLCLNLEGTEARVLAHGGDWPSRVRSIRVELHPQRGFLGDDCKSLLERLGFTSWFELDRHGGWGFGLGNI